MRRDRSSQGASARVDPEVRPDLSGSEIDGEFANDSLGRNQTTFRPAGAKRRYVTKSRVAAVSAAMNHRHRLVLDTVRLLRVATAAQLVRLHYADTPSARRLARGDLAWMTETQLLGRLGRRIGGVRAGSSGYVYSLGLVGQRLAYPDRTRYRQPWTPSRAFLDHALAVSDLYVGLRTRPALDVELVSFAAEPACWRAFVGPGGSPVVLKPDGYLQLAGPRFEDHWFVEVDCATESTTRIRRKAEVYVRYWQTGREQARSGVFPKTLFVAPDEQRRAALTRALSQLDAEHWHLFATAVGDEVIEQLTRPLTEGSNSRKEVT